MSFSCCHICHWINAFKGKISDVVIFEQITDPFRPFLSIRNHTLKKMKSLRVQWVSFYAQVAYCLKTEALVVLWI